MSVRSVTFRIAPAPSSFADAGPPALVGRERELAALRDAVRPGLLVITGPPGVGKSALVAAALASRDDLLHVDLCRARTADDFWAALGRSLSINLQRLDAAAEHVVRLLRARGKHVVVLDPGELLDGQARSALGALLSHAPELCWVLASVVAPAFDTSPCPVCTLALGPLPVDDAVTLLVQRAAAQSVDSPPDPDDPAWRRIAQRLDGLPLALELAAARVPLLTPAALLERVEDARTLAGGRHASADGALRHAWALLGAEEQADLAALSSLRGSFSLEAAEVALGPDGLDRLARLRQRSALIVRDGRFQHLDGLRRLAEEQAPQAAAAGARRLIPWWAERGARLRRELRGPRGDAASDELAADQPHLWAAWELARQVDPVAAADIAASLLTSMHSSGPAWAVSGLTGLSEVAQAVGGHVGAELRNRWGALLLLLYRTDEARAVLLEALAMAEVAGSAEALSMTLSNLGLLHMTVGEVDRARAALARAAAAAPDDAQAAFAFARLGALELRHDNLDAAADALVEARERILRGAFPRLAGTVHLNLGITRAEQGRVTEAEELVARALDETRGQDEGGHAFARFYLALLALARGDEQRALALCEPAVATLDGLGSPVFRGYARIPLALARWSLGDRAGAQELLIQAVRLLEPYDGVNAALARMWRAALDAAAGDASLLAEAIESGRATGSDPDLIAVLATYDGSAPLPPEPPNLTLYARVARRLARPAPVDARIARDGRWFEVAGERVDLSRRGYLNRLVATLAQARVDRPGAGLSVDELFEAGWPGQQILPEAAAGRVYTAVRELRVMGLGDVLARQDDGYLLDPGRRVDIEA